MTSLKEAKKLEHSDCSSLTYEEAACVPLSDELHGSLRQVVPKGNRAKDHQNNMVSAGITSTSLRRNRRAYEKPHASKNIKWIPKYHY